MQQKKSKYKSRIEWMRSDLHAYRAAVKNGLLQKICENFGWEFPKKRKPNNHWTLETCKEDALKYKSRIEWELNNSSAYSIALKNGWIDECCSHMIRTVNKPWTLEECKKDALKHTKRSLWQKAKKSGYWTAKDNGWLDECCAHMSVKTNWTIEACREDALKYEKQFDWKKLSPRAFKAAWRHGWLEECCKHMKSGYAKRKV